jgi:hypothetical protein
VDNSAKKELVLLVGDNPLPNYVTAKYLIQRGELTKIVLLHSKDTVSIARNIENLLSHDGSVEIALAELEDVNDRNSILSSLERLRFDNSVHFNYTGGTKVMAVHVYNYLKEQRKEAEFSYLNSRTYKLVYDDSGSKVSLINEVDIGVEEMLHLHSFNKVSITKNISYEETLKVLEKMILSDQIGKYIESFQRIFRDDIHDKKITKLKINSLKEHVKKHWNADKFREISKHKELCKVINSLPNELPFLENWEYKAGFCDSLTNKKAKELLLKPLEFMDGKWGDEYVFSIISTLAEKRELKEDKIGCSLKASRQDSKEFELDNFVIRGYLLTGISVTTSNNRTICKGKAFEVMMRTSQIGGSESKAVLLTRLNEEDAKSLERDIQLKPGERSRLKVLSKEQWKREILTEELEDFIWG